MQKEINSDIYNYMFDNIRTSYGYNFALQKNKNSVEDTCSQMQ